MNSVLSSTLRDATYEWLDRLDELARTADEQSRTLLAETELVRLIEAWRVLLAEHEPDEDGCCPTCVGRWRRRRGYRCPVWSTAHRHLVAAEPESAGGRHALTNGGRSLW